MLNANGGRFEINQLLFSDDTVLVADSEEKLCRLVSEFCRVCEGKCKVMKCSRHGNNNKNNNFIETRLQDTIGK